MPVGRRSARWRRWLGPLLALAAMGAACGDDDGADPATTSTTATTEASSTSSTTTTSTVPERQPSTTTTAFDPATVEGEVEAAYLKSWDVYADAVYNLELDEEALAEVYAGDALTTVAAEVERRIDRRQPSKVWIEHRYEVTPNAPDLAYVVDVYTNHQVRLDPDTYEPVEADPNEQVVYSFEIRKQQGLWRVTRIEKVQL